MAERPNHLQGYPMPQSNFMNLAQQQQSSMAYQQPQAAMNPAHQIPGVPNPEQRMWQQIQDRHRAMGGADGMGQQQLNPQQMADLLRSQAALSQAQNHQQSQQQPPQLQQAQQFTNLGGMAQMNNTLPSQNALLAMQRQQGMQGGSMGGVSNAQLTPNMAQILAAQRNGVTNPAMIQMNRQLGLLNRAQKQQPQNGPANFAQPGPSFGGQQNFPFPPGAFPPKPDEGRIAAVQGPQQFPATPGVLNGVSQAHGFPNEILQRALRNGDGRPLTFDELRFKAAQLKRTIEAERAALENVPKPTTQDAVMAYREKQREIQTRELVFSKILEHTRILASQQGVQQPGPANAADAPGAATMSSMGFPNASQQQSQTWMPQMNNINMPNQPTGGLPGNQQMHGGPAQNGPAQAARQHTNSPFHASLGQPQQQQTPIPRSGPTPQQQQMLQAFLQQQSGNQSSPPSSAPGVLPGQGKFGQQASALEVQETQHRPNSLSFPPLARERFMGLLQEWWKRSGINFDPRMITIGNRQIDINQLHQLHTEVLQLGGVVNVQRHDLWNVIAAKMGWTAAAISESGHTQDQIAEQIKVVYERLLQSFEQTYMSAAMKHSLTAQPPLDHHIAPNQPSSGPSQPPLSSQQAVQVIKLASMSAEQLRANGYPENLIQNIERSRPQLEVTWRKMQMQRIQAAQQQQLPQQQQQQQQQFQQQGALLNASLPFQNQLQAQASLHNPSSLPSQGGLPNANTLSHPGLSAGSSQSTEFPGQQRPGLNASQLTQQNIQMLGMLSNLNLRKPTPEMVKQATSTIDQLKQDVSKERTFRPEHVRHLSDAEKGVFPGQFENLCNVIRDISRFYHVYLAATSDLPLIKGIINMLDMCDKQRQLVQSANPVYVLDIGTLQRLTKTAVEVKGKIFAAVQQLRAMSQMEQNQARAALPQQGEGGQALPPPIQQSQSPANIAPSPAPIPPRPPTVQPQPPHLPQQNLRPPPARTPQMAPARPSSVVHSRAKAPTGTSPNAQDTVPSPSASTPLPSGATPSHVQTSPQTPKSPKGKGQTKPRQKARRQSKVVQPHANAVPVTSAPPSTAPSAAVAPTSTPASEPAPSPAQAASSPAESSLKRSREDEPADQAASALPSRAAADETPSKRIKTDWENVPDAEPSKRQAEAESIKTPGQAAQFYNDMTQILELSNDTALPPELHDTLAQLVKTVGHGLEVPDAAGSSSVGLPNGGTSSPKVADGDDSFFSFLDFTAFQQDDEKVDTPELVPTSSTNPSPESGAGSETEHPPAPATSGSVGDRAKIVDSSESEPKNDLFDMGADSLRLGIWGEIDGGESGYFNSSDMWKWDSIPPSSGDNSWAIST